MSSVVTQLYKKRFLDAKAPTAGSKASTYDTKVRETVDLFVDLGK